VQQQAGDGLAATWAWVDMDQTSVASNPANSESSSVSEAPDTREPATVKTRRWPGRHKQAKSPSRKGGDQHRDAERAPMPAVLEPQVVTVRNRSGRRAGQDRHRSSGASLLRSHMTGDTASPSGGIGPCQGLSLGRARDQFRRTVVPMRAGTRLGRTCVLGAQALRLACHTDGRAVDIGVIGRTFSSDPDFAAPDGLMVVS
jgi:hypothetical protein